jgi:methylated-DNA-[protein]-cysteine S-methyltransferase
VVAASPHNPLPLVVPCHRVVGAGGKLVGFGGGLPRKRFLLALEARVRVERDFSTG